MKDSTPQTKKDSEETQLYNPIHWFLYSLIFSPIVPAIFYYRNCKILEIPKRGKKVFIASVLTFIFLLLYLYGPIPFFLLHYRDSILLLLDNNPLDLLFFKTYLVWNETNILYFLKLLILNPIHQDSYIKVNSSLGIVWSLFFALKAKEQWGEYKQRKKNNPKADCPNEWSILTPALFILAVVIILALREDARQSIF